MYPVVVFALLTMNSIACAGPGKSFSVAGCVAGAAVPQEP